MSSLKEKLVGIVGPAGVSEEESALLEYSRDRSFAKPMKPRFVVKVKNASEVQALVKLANETKTPLVPVSSRGPRRKGDTVPTAPEAVIVDLSGMKKIININRQQRMAVVEPGVTYEELLPALAKEGLTISVPLAPKAGKSVVASVLDMEPRLNALHQWNFIDPLRCTEVVWGDGNRMFTGEAGGSPMDLAKQWEAEKWQVSGTGPMMLDFYRLLTGSQGSMGIVTWASLKCDIDTQVHEMHFATGKKLTDVTELAYKVTRLRLGNELMVVNGPCLASLLGESAAEVAALARELPNWIAMIGIGGRDILPEERVRSNTLDIADLAQSLGLELKSGLPGIAGDKALAKVMSPSASRYWKDTYKGASQDIFFTTTLDETPKFVARMQELAEEAGYPAGDIGVYIQPQNMGTCYHLEFTLPYDEADKAQRLAVEGLFTKASEAFSSMGAYYLRPHGIWARLQMNKDAASAQLLKKLKGIFDPNGIMNTGKLGV
jgi:FAD/FMN-containing dehydrogenase